MYEELLESSEFYQKRYHNFSSKIILPVFALLVFLLVFLAFMKKEMTVKSVGTVEPVEVLAQIQSTSAHKIVSNALEENKVVNVGEILIRYDAVSDIVQQDTIKKQLEGLQKQKEQLELLKKSLEAGRSQFSAEDSFGYESRFDDYLHQRQTLISGVSQQNGTIASQNHASANAKNAIGGAMEEISQKIGDYQLVKMAISTGSSVDQANQGYSLYVTYLSQRQGATTDEEREVLKNQILTQIDTQIQQYQTEFSNYQIQYESAGVQQAYNSSLESQLSSLRSQKLSEVGQELVVLEQEITELEGGVRLQTNTLSQREIVSNVRGLIHMNQEVQSATFVPEGTVMAQIYPLLTEVKEVGIETYIPSGDISSLEVGDTLKFKTQDSSNKEVVLVAQISSIDSNATKTENGSYFKVVAVTKLSDKEAQILKYGQSGDIVVVTGDKTYLDYLLDKFWG